MEAFTDGYGNWRFLPFAGALGDQPAPLMDDLLTWRRLLDIARRQVEKDKKEQDAGT